MLPNLRLLGSLSLLPQVPLRRRTYRDKPTFGLGVVPSAWFTGNRDPATEEGRGSQEGLQDRGLGSWGPSLSGQGGKKECTIGLRVPDGEEDPRAGRMRGVLGVMRPPTFVVTAVKSPG